MSWHYIMIPNEILRLIRRHHKTRNFQLATKICDDLYKEIKYSDINFDEVRKMKKPKIFDEWFDMVYPESETGDYEAFKTWSVEECDECYEFLEKLLKVKQVEK